MVVRKGILVKSVSQQSAHALLLKCDLFLKLHTNEQKTILRVTMHPGKVRAGVNVLKNICSGAGVRVRADMP